MNIDPNTLPDDAESLKKILFNTVSSYQAVIDKKDAQISSLLEHIRLEKARRFGASSEKYVGQGELFDEAEAIEEGVDASVDEAKEESVASSETPNTQAKKGRKPLPEALPRIEEVIELAESERTCLCGTCKTEIGCETSERLDIIPAKLRVLVTKRIKYACAQCEEGVQTAPLPAQLLPKSHASAGTLAYVITAKYQDGLPLHRLANILTRYGIDTPKQTLSNWVLSTATQLEPMTQALQQHLRQGSVIHMDETTVQVLNEEAKTPQSKSYMWVQKGGPPERPAVLFNYHRSRSGEVPARLLKGYVGALMTDGYTGYHQVVAENGGITHLICMAHLRRKFVEADKVNKPKHGKAKKTGVNRAQYMLSQIKKLYAIEAKARHLSETERYTLRQTEAIPVLAHIKGWLDKTAPKVAPKTKLGEALAYALKHWVMATRYIENGAWPIDNNPAENAIRPFVIGRKNWLFSHSVRGAQASALLYSLIETAKLNRLEPYDYLKWLFTEWPKGDRKTEHLMPWAVSQEELDKLKC